MCVTTEYVDSYTVYSNPLHWYILERYGCQFKTEKKNIPEEKKQRMAFL